MIVLISNCISQVHYYTSLLYIMFSNAVKISGQHDMNINSPFMTDLIIKFNPFPGLDIFLA